MDKINLNLYGLNFQKQVEKKDDKKAQNEEKTPVEGQQKDVDSEAIFSAMQLSAAQNKAVVLGGALSIDHSKYQTDESIKRIQDSVAGFEKAVDNAKNIVTAEFPGLSEAQINELAAKAVLNTL